MMENENSTQEAGGDNWAAALDAELKTKGAAAVRKNYMISLPPGIHKAGRLLAIKRDKTFSALIGELIAAALENGTK